MVECTLSITHCLRLNLQLHTIDLVRTCRISSFCNVAWQLARFHLTRRIARSLGDSWASCCCSCVIWKCDEMSSISCKSCCQWNGRNRLYNRLYEYVHDAVFVSTLQPVVQPAGCLYTRCNCLVHTARYITVCTKRFEYSYSFLALGGRGLSSKFLTTCFSWRSMRGDRQPLLGGWCC